jgi:hypothetical protein
VSDLRKAAEMALEALMQATLEDVMVEVEPNVWEYKSIVAINALRQALTPEVTPEVTPEGWVKIDEVRKYFDSVGCGTIYKTAGEGRVPLYTAPYTKLDTTDRVLHKEWVGLTHDEVMCIWYENGFECMIYAKAIEAKLKDKNVPKP